MRELNVSLITETIERLCIEACNHLPEDVKRGIRTCRVCEDGEIAKGILDNIITNFNARESFNFNFFTFTSNVTRIFTIL